VVAPAVPPVVAPPAPPALLAPPVAVDPLDPAVPPEPPVLDLPAAPPVADEPPALEPPVPPADVDVDPSAGVLESLLEQAAIAPPKQRLMPRTPTIECLVMRRISLSAKPKPAASRFPTR
jgi:hypothetical protein